MKVTVDLMTGEKTIDPFYVAPSFPNPIPRRVTPSQARKALLAIGLLDDVEAAVAVAPREIQIAWEYANVIERDSPALAALAAGLGLTSQQIDNLFLAASEM